MRDRAAGAAPLLALALPAAAYLAALAATPRLPAGGAALAVLLLAALAVWSFRVRGREVGSAVALGFPVHVLIATTGQLASPLAPLAVGWLWVVSRRASPRGLAVAALAAAGAGVVAALWGTGTLAFGDLLRWLLLVAVGAGLSAGVPGRALRARPRAELPVAPERPRRPGGEVSAAEAVEGILATVMRAADAHEAALWRAEGEGEERVAVLLARVAAPDVAAPESPVPLAGHPFAWAVDERLPQRLERGKRALPAPWAAEMLLVPVETSEGARILALGYPGVVPPGAEAAAVRGAGNLAVLLGLLRTRSAVRRAEAGMRALAEAVRTLPGELELDKFAAQLAAAVLQGTGAAGAVVAMATDDTGRGKVLQAAGTLVPLDAEGFGEGESRVALAVKHGVELSHADLRRERDRLPLLTRNERWETPPRSAAVIPLMLDGRAMGAVAAWHPEPSRFADREMEIVRLLCSVAPLPMRSARRFEALDQRASSDPLTGLANRSVFEARLAALSGVFDRYARPFAVIALDVDHFKRVNDGWGHEAGDRVLVHVADLLRHAVRDVDLPARIGGEEFVVLLPETGLRPAAEVAERIRRMVEARGVGWNGRPLRVTASLGVAAVPDCTPHPAELLGLADAALYRAKGAGRNRVDAAPKAERAVLEP